MTIIRDAQTGSGAQVGQQGRLFVQSESVPVGALLAAEGDNYGIATQDFTLTSGGESGVLYFRYAGADEGVVAVVTRLTVTIGASTGGVDNTAIFTLYKNPTGGTLISNGTAITAENRNFARGDGLTGTKLKGAEGLTVTGGEALAAFRFSNLGVNVFDIADTPYVLESGNSLAFTCTPPSGNTSATYRAFIAVYLLKLI